MLEQVITSGSHAQPVRGLELVTAGTGLVSNLKAFLLDCRIRELSPLTVYDYDKFLSEFIAYCSAQGVKQASEVTRQVIQLFLVKKRETCNKETVQHYYRNLRRFFGWLADPCQAVIPANPLIGWKPAKPDEVIITPFDREQVKSLITLCDASYEGLRNKAIILMFLDTGLRRTELATLKIEDVDFDSELVKTMGKGNHEKWNRICKQTQKALLHYLMQRKDSSPALWVSQDGKPLLPGAVYQMIRKLGQRAGLKGVRCSPHTLRHTAGTMLMENGADERTVQEILGHKTAAMTRRYTKTLSSKWAADKHRAFSPVDNLFGKHKG